MVDLPRAIATVTVDEADLDGVLADLGLPPMIGGVAGVDATFRAVSPGYDPASTDPLLRTGGIELAARLGIEGLVDDANFRIAMSPPTDGVLPDLIGHAAVGQVGPLGGWSSARCRSTSCSRTDSSRSAWTARPRSWDARAQRAGDAQPRSHRHPGQVEFDSGGPRLAGFDVRTGWVLTVTRVNGQLVSTFAFDGDGRLPRLAVDRHGPGQRPTPPARCPPTARSTWRSTSTR